MTPTLWFWAELFARLGLEIGLLSLLAMAIARRVSSAHRGRDLWRACLAGCVLLVACEGFGLGPRLIDAFTPARAVRQTPYIPPDQHRPDEEPNWSVGPLEAVDRPLVARPEPAVWWPGWIWLVGFMVVLGWAVVVRLLTLARLKRSRVTDAELCERTRWLGERLGLGRSVVLTESPLLVSPVALGILRPEICLPQGFASAFGESRQAVLAHELAHIANHDAIWHGLADAAVACLWWHPLSWRARRNFLTACELAADEASLVSERGPERLAAGLVELGRRLSAAKSCGWPGAASGGFSSELAKRVERLMTLEGRGWEEAVSKGSGRRLVVGGAVMICVVTVMTALASQLGPRESRGAGRESLAGLFVAAVRAQAADEKVPESFGPAAVPAARTPIYDKDGMLVTRAVDAQREGPPARVPGLNSAKAPIYDNDGMLVTRAVDAHRDETRTMRIFRLNPAKLWRHLKERKLVGGPEGKYVLRRPEDYHGLWDFEPRERAGEANTAMFEGLSAELGARGLVMEPPFQMFYNQRTSVLAIYATMPELEVVEGIVNELQSPAPQILIESQFIEIEGDETARSGAVDFLKSLPGVRDPVRLLTKEDGTSSAYVSMGPEADIALGEAVPPDPGAVLGVLNSDQRPVVMNGLKKRAGVNFLSAPIITTYAERESQIKAVNILKIVSGVTEPDANGDIGLATRSIECGPMLNVTGWVPEDGNSLGLSLSAQVTEFIGYDTTDEKVRLVRNGQEEWVTKPNPIVRCRRINAEALIPIGATLVVGGLSVPNAEAELGLRGELNPAEGFRSRPKSTLLVFVTVKRITPEGNPLD